MVQAWFKIMFRFNFFFNIFFQKPAFCGVPAFCWPDPVEENKKKKNLVNIINLIS